MSELLHDAEIARRLDITPQQLRLIIKRNADFPPIEAYQGIKLRQGQPGGQGERYRVTTLPVRDFEKIKVWMKTNKEGEKDYKPNRSKNPTSTLANSLMRTFLAGGKTSSQDLTPLDST